MGLQVGGLLAQDDRLFVNTIEYSGGVAGTPLPPPYPPTPPSPLPPPYLPPSCPLPAPPTPPQASPSLA